MSENSIKFKLSKVSIKPFFELKIENRSVKCLYDSGADTPVWVADAPLFSDVFPNAIKLNEVFHISGFGGKECTELPAFEIPVFRFGPVTFARMVIATDYNRKFGCDLVLGSSLFRHARVLVDRFNQDDLNHPPSVTYQFDRKFYKVMTFKENGIIKRSVILSQETVHGQPQLNSLNVF